MWPPEKTRYRVSGEHGHVFLKFLNLRMSKAKMSMLSLGYHRPPLLSSVFIRYAAIYGAVGIDCGDRFVKCQEHVWFTSAIGDTQ